MGVAERLFDAMRSAIQMRGDVDRNAADLALLAERVLDHEKRLVRLETRDELRIIQIGRALPPPV